MNNRRSVAQNYPIDRSNAPHEYHEHATLLVEKGAHIMDSQHALDSKKLPYLSKSVREVLTSRSIYPHPQFGDYGDYIEANETKRCVGLFPSIISAGSMHHALGRTRTVKDY
jgi:hypothetical protein